MLGAEGIHKPHRALAKLTELWKSLLHKFERARKTRVPVPTWTLDLKGCAVRVLVLLTAQMRGVIRNWDD